MTGITRKSVFFLLFIILTLMLPVITVVAQTSQKGILVVTDSANADMMQRTDALKKYLAYYRQKSGHSASTMPILVYDYNDSRVREYCQDKLGIKRDDILFVGIVAVRGQVPLKVHMKVVDPKDLENNARGLVERITGPPSEETPTVRGEDRGIVRIESEPAGARVFVDGREYGHTPLTLRELESGRHVVVMQLEDKRWKGEFHTSPGREAEVRHSFLDPTGTPIPPRLSPPEPEPEPTSAPVMDAFIPRSEANQVFRVTVSNLEDSMKIKDHYKPKPGHKFLIVYLSQQNISGELQVYSGKLSLMDNGNNTHEAIENLSNFWLVVLRPGGMITGYLVYEIPVDARPASIVLHDLNMPPLTVNLQ